MNFKEFLQESIDKNNFIVTAEKSQFGGWRGKVEYKETGKAMYLSSVAFTEKEFAKDHALSYLNAYAKLGMHAADRAARDYAKLNADKIIKK